MLLYLIRHGRTDWNDDRRVMGLSPVPLNRRGKQMVEALAEHLSGEGIGAVYTSTVERALETARILSDAWGAPLHEEPRLNESPYEKWIGMSYSQLSGDRDFKLYQSAPTMSDFSSGEGMKEIQQRALGAVGRIEEEALFTKAALVSHSDVIKPVMTHYLGMDLDSMHRLAVANASVSLLDLRDSGESRIRYMNLMPWKWKFGENDGE
jgi:broad specificity phosphatase PhoE